MFDKGRRGRLGVGMGVLRWVGIVLIIEVVVLVEESVILARLYLAAITLLAEGEVEVVALKADPVLAGGILDGARVPIVSWRRVFSSACHPFDFYL